MSASRTHDVTVLGSLNLDVIIGVDLVPGAGETVLARAREEGPGGKGLNQAVAVARAGAATAMVGAVGADDAAQVLLDAAGRSGVDISSVRRVPGASGTAWVMVQGDGDNAIVVDSAANGTLDALTADERRIVAGGRLLVAQLETPLPAITEAAAVARAAEVLFVLNAAPAQTLSAELLDLVDVLVVNEHEARHLTDGTDPGEAARILQRQVGAVVVTLGAHGALVVDDAGPRTVPGIPAEAVDTTGAGDTFTGVLAAALAAGASLDDGCARAVVAGALAVETAGAIASIPTRDQVDDRMGR